jgi:hybrid cluster-associated redox disulfide protein
MSREKIDVKKNITELITEYPELAPILTYEYGLYCMNCIIADFDNIEQGAKLHGITGKYYDEMVAHLESIINSK